MSGEVSLRDTNYVLLLKVISDFDENASDNRASQTFIKNKTKFTPRACGILLGYAIMNNLEHTTHIILEHPDVEINLPTSDPTIPNILRIHNPFISSAKTGNIKIMKLLIELGANPNATDIGTGSTALHYAASLDNKEMVEYLLDTLNVDINVMDVNMVTPIIQATRDAAEHTAYELLARNADVNKVSLHGEFALMNAVENEMDYTVELIMDTYNTYTLYDVNGQTPLHIAIVEGYNQLVEIMLDKGFPVDTPTSGGDTPIILCSRNFDDRVFDLLLARGADIHQVTQEGETLLHNVVYVNNAYNLSDFLSIISQKFKSKKEFIKFINKPNNNGETPLNVAVQHSLNGVIDTLLSYGSDPMIVDYTARSPFLFAIALNAWSTMNKFLKVSNLDMVKKTLNTITMDGCLPLQYAIDHYINFKAQADAVIVYGSSFFQNRVNDSVDIMNACMLNGTNLKTIQSSGMTLEDYIVYKQVEPLLQYVNDKYTPSPNEPDELKALRPIKRAELQLQKTRKLSHPKSTSPKSNASIKPYDPILMENHTIDEWLSAHPDNIIFVFNGKQWCMKRSYFMPDLISPYNVLQDCVKGKSGKYNTLGEKYIHLQMVGIPNSGILALRELAFVSNPQSTQRIYTLHSSKNRISTANEMEMTMTTIHNKQLAEASIDLHNEDVFGVVERKYISHMIDYTYKWDGRVNYYLRSGKSDEDFAKDALHLQHYTEYAPTPTEAVQRLKDKIRIFDEIFSKFSVISPKPITVYRGVKNAKKDKPYEGLQAGYISTSTDINVAFGFSHAHKTGCCIYKFTILPGVPFISMYRHSHFQEELEILLPRGLTIDITGRSEIKGVQHYECEVRLSSPDQFKHMLHQCYMHPIITVDKPFHFTDIVNEVQAKKDLANRTRSREKTLRKTRSLGLSRSKGKRITKRNLDSKHSK